MASELANAHFVPRRLCLITFVAQQKRIDCVRLRNAIQNVINIGRTAGGIRVIQSLESVSLIASLVCRKVARRIVDPYQLTGLGGQNLPNH